MEQLDCEFESYPILTVIASGANCHHDSVDGQKLLPDLDESHYECSTQQC